MSEEVEQEHAEAAEAIETLPPPRAPVQFSCCSTDRRQRLAELKERRQIIVCTHDPNILVGGDAEQVVVLEAESDRRASVVRHGSIDNAGIVDMVVDLLEGGAEAFVNRRKRYAGRVGPPS